jgi:cell division septation protein DedD
VAVVVFLCGVLVGRGVPPGRAGAADGTMMTPTQIVSDAGTDPAGAEPPSTDPGTKAGAALSYSERLGKTPPAEQPLKAPAAVAPPQPPPESAPPAVEEQVSTPPDAPSGPGEWTVQVAATKNRADADAAVRYLKTKGFEGRVFVPDADDKVGGLRVRVGTFPTKKEAEAFAQRIARETRYKDPWITR